MDKYAIVLKLGKKLFISINTFVYLCDSDR